MQPHQSSLFHIEDRRHVSYPPHEAAFVVFRQPGKSVSSRLRAVVCNGVGVSLESHGIGAPAVLRR